MDYFGIKPHQAGVGNVYYVVTSSHAQVDYFSDNYEKTYGDGSVAVHATIQAALDVTVTERNDYVIVPPQSANINLTAALTMSKNRVHLVCPTNIGSGGMAFSNPIISTNGQTVAAITLSGSNCEIAGLFFKGAEDYDIIDINAGIRGPNIHDNFFGMAASDADTNKGIDATDIYFFNISNNHFTNYLPGAVTTTTNDIAAFISILGGGATRGIIRGNTFTTGANTVVAAGVNAIGHELVIDGNLFHQTGNMGGAVDAGTFTKGIIAHNNVCVSRNVFTGALTAGNCINGPTADSCVSNFGGTDGEIRVDPDGSHNYETS